jgi:hypothetical protein
MKKYLLKAGTEIERVEHGRDEFETFVTTKDAHYEEGEIRRSSYRPGFSIIDLPVYGEECHCDLCGAARPWRIRVNQKDLHVYDDAKREIKNREEFREVVREALKEKLVEEVQKLIVKKQDELEELVKGPEPFPKRPHKRNEKI